jgi:hypothetical protein
MTLEYWDVEEWYPDFKTITFRTEFVPLSGDMIDSILRKHEDSKDANLRKSTTEDTTTIATVRNTIFSYLPI